MAPLFTGEFYQDAIQDIKGGVPPHAEFGQENE
jgi:hypothetical protein